MASPAAGKCKERHKKGECAFKLVKGSMKSFELNKGNILPEKTKKNPDLCGHYQCLLFLLTFCFMLKTIIHSADGNHQ